MRRQIIVLSLALLLVAGGVFAGYPEDYFGPPLPEGCIKIEAYVPSGWFLDRNPWSMPSPEESIFWFGTLCVEGPVAVLEFTELGSRYCKPSIFNPNIEECYARTWLTISKPDRHVMAWDTNFEPDWGFYIASVHTGDWTWTYDSLTNNDNGTMTFVTGTFDFITPLWWVESDNHTRWKFLVSEKHTPNMKLTRRSASRVQ